MRIAPTPGGLEYLESKLPHPGGFIETRLRFDPGRARCLARITLPPRVTGVLVWRGREHPLAAGKETVMRAE